MRLSEKRNNRIFGQPQAQPQTTTAPAPDPSAEQSAIEKVKSAMLSAIDKFVVAMKGE